MRRTLLAAVLVAASLPSLAFATAFTPKLPVSLETDESVATTDDARAMLMNPAGLGVRYPNELFSSYTRRDTYHEWNSTLLQAGGFGFLALRQRDTSQTYGLAFAGGGERFRVGWVPYWRVDARTHEVSADHRVGVMSRPYRWLSAGFTIEHAFQPIFRGERLGRLYTIAAGVRPLALVGPLAHTWGTRLTLSSDVVIADDGEWRQARVRTGAEFEVLPGVALRAMAEDHENLKLGVMLRGLHWGVHGGTTRDDGHYVSNTYAASWHGGEEKTALVPRAAHRVAVVRAAGALADESIGGLALLGGGSTVSAAPVRRQLERALDDPLTRGVLLDVRGVSGMAQVEELRPRIAALRAAGKPVVAYLEYGAGRADLYLASACERVVATEGASFAALGLRSERRSYRSALAEFGVRMDRSSIGAYKSAFRNYSVDATPSADSIAIEHALDQSQSLFVNALAESRRVPAERFAALLDGRWWTARDAVAAGVVDSIGWREDAVRVLGRLAGLGAKPHTIALAKARPARRVWTAPARVAIVYASGGIETGRSGNDLLTGPYFGEETLIAQLERAFHAPGIRAVVLRIDSPGGSVIASDLVDHAIQRLRHETGKPLVVSMGSVAASGGYYIACHADRIYADRHTRTGSIGVLFVKPSFEQAYAKRHVRQDDFDRGAYMKGWSIARDWTPELQASADSTIRRDYDAFVAKVAEGRKLPLADVYERAQGRVWLGDDALARGLIDQIGGLDDALADARRRAGVAPGEKIRPLEFGRPRPGFLQRLLGGWLSEALAREASLRAWDGARAVDPGTIDALTE